MLSAAQAMSNTRDDLSRRAALAGLAGAAALAAAGPAIAGAIEPNPGLRRDR